MHIELQYIDVYSNAVVHVQVTQVTQVTQAFEDVTT